MEFMSDTKPRMLKLLLLLLDILLSQCNQHIEGYFVGESDQLQHSLAASRQVGTALYFHILLSWGYQASRNCIVTCHIDTEKKNREQQRAKN